MSNGSHECSFAQDEQNEDFTEYENMANGLESMWNRYREIYKKSPDYIICDIDTRFDIMNNPLMKVQIENAGGYRLNGMLICIVDGLAHKKVLEVR